MSESRNSIKNKVSFIDGYAYVAGGHQAEKFDYKEKKWIPLPGYPIKGDLGDWTCALTFIPQEIEKEKITRDEI